MNPLPSAHDVDKATNAKTRSQAKHARAMSTVELKLFGLPQLIEENDAKALRLNNPSLLLIYLAVKGTWVSRSELAFLFRPDEDEKTALKHIRLLLHRAKQLSWAFPLEVEQGRVRFAVQTDVADFKAAIAVQDWESAVEQYSQTFLGDYSAADLATYSAWIDLERSDLEQAFEDALKHHAQSLEETKAYDKAADVYSMLLKVDDLAEETVQALLKVLHLAGKRDKALKIYDDFAKRLLDEYDAEPIEVTTELARSIRAATFKHDSFEKPLYKHYALPKQSTRFVGREDELKKLSKQLRQNECRLLTLIGLGGVGKTRLAIELAQLVQPSFRDGVCFVALAPLTTATILPTIAQQLGISLSPTQDPLEQLCAYLAEKELLLILDNFEHVVEAASLCTRLLEGTAKLSILVSSRKRLSVSSEWLYDVDGLSYGVNSQVGDGATLFLNSAKRVAPRFEPSEDDVLYINNICERVEGLPLAIELAASWVRILSVERIAKELEKGYELLKSTHSDLPERHRDLEAILETTWQKLSKKKDKVSPTSQFFRGAAHSRQLRR